MLQHWSSVKFLNWMRLYKPSGEVIFWRGKTFPSDECDRDVVVYVCTLSTVIVCVVFCCFTSLSSFCLSLSVSLPPSLIFLPQCVFLENDRRRAGWLPAVVGDSRLVCMESLCLQV